MSETDGPPRITRAKLRDPTFFRKNRRAVEAAMQAGTIDSGDKSPEKGPIFTQSQLRDVKFFRENQLEIERAAREGRVIKDVKRARRVGGALDAQPPPAPVDEQPSARSGGTDFSTVEGRAVSDRAIRQSQLRDPKYFRENQKAIEQAQREGRVLRDLWPR